MKSTKFAIGGDEAKIAAFGGALAESVLDDTDAEEQGDSGGDESDGGKPNGDDDSSEMEGAEASFEAKYEAVLQLIFGSFKPIARSRSTKEDGILAAFRFFRRSLSLSFRRSFAALC